MLHLLNISKATIIHSQERSFLRLLSGCPFLEDLSFTSQHFKGEYNVYVSMLKRFMYTIIWI